jgi:hypothetical protein
MISGIFRFIYGTLETFFDKTASGSLAAGDTTSVVGPIACNGASSGRIQLTGTFAGSIVVETTGLASPGASDWTSIRCYNETTAASQNPITTGVGTFTYNVGSAKFVRARRSNSGSGTAVIELNVSAAPNAQKVVSPNLNDFLTTAYQGGVWSVSNNDSQRASYSAAVVNLSVANNATDFFTITGSGTSVIRIMKIVVDATQNTAGIRDVIAIKRSTANTGGTSTTLTNVNHDSTDAAASAVIRAYTANPTLGTAIGNVRAAKIFIGDTGKSGSANASSFLFFDGANKAMELRTANEVLALNFNGQTAAGNSFNIGIEWTESST